MKTPVCVLCVQGLCMDMTNNRMGLNKPFKRSTAQTPDKKKPGWGQTLGRDK